MMSTDECFGKGVVILCRPVNVGVQQTTVMLFINQKNST